MSDGPQSGHGWGPVEQLPVGYPTATAEPDWVALAEQHQQEGRRRKQLQVIGAVVGATLVIGGITATAVSLSGSGGNGPAAVVVGASTPAGTDPSTGAGPLTAPGESAFAPSGSPSAAASSSSSAKPATTRPATPSPGSSGARDPLTVISSAATDTAPLDPATLFAARTLTLNGRTWTRLIVASASPCWNATTGHLGDPLTAQNCRALLRATYTSGNSAVTIGVAVFDSRAQADASDQGYKGQIQGLLPAGSVSYCVTPGCVNSHAAVGRYGYFTVAGTTKPGGTAADATATATAPDLAAYARAQLLARGQ